MRMHVVNYGRMYGPYSMGARVHACRHLCTLACSQAGTHANPQALTGSRARGRTLAEKSTRSDPGDKLEKMAGNCCLSKEWESRTDSSSQRRLDDLLLMVLLPTEKKRLKKEKNRWKKREKERKR